MYSKKKLNYLLTFFLFLFLCVSYFTLSSAVTYLSSTLGNLALKQIGWYLTGSMIVLIILQYSLDDILKCSFYIYLFHLLLLLCLIFFAPEINGSKSWFILPGVGSIQPSEFMKIALILLNVTLLKKYHQVKNKNIKNEFILILKFFIVLFIPALLTFLQPDTGMVIIYFMISFFMLFTSGISKWWFFSFGIFLTIFLGLFLYLYFQQADLFISLFGNQFFYRMDRIINWQAGSGMQLTNSLIAIGSSGILGHGFRNTPIYFPEAGTDFIFTVFSSNYGFIGSILLLIIFVAFDLYLIKIALQTKNASYKALMSGVIGMLLYQQIQNISMTIGLLPITGITLPFISYGGSSLLSYFIAMAFVYHIDYYNKCQKSYK